MDNKRAISVHQLMTTRYKLMQFNGVWEELIGCPELKGCWIIWGPSFSGKTSFAVKLAKYLTQFGKVAYNSIEEGNSMSFKLTCIRENIEDVANRFMLLDMEPLDELDKRLMRPKSPKVIFIDSLQYVQANKNGIKRFIDKHNKKLFIFISHAKGKDPEGSTAEAVKYHSPVKIRVEGYRAFVQSRYKGHGTAEYYPIWDQGAAMYWGEND